MRAMARTRRHGEVGGEGEERRRRRLDGDGGVPVALRGRGGAHRVRLGSAMPEEGSAVAGEA